MKTLSVQNIRLSARTFRLERPTALLALLVVGALAFGLVSSPNGVQAQDDLVFQSFPSERNRLILQSCSLFDGHDRITITKRGNSRSISLPKSLKRQAHIVKRRYEFFTCEPKDDGGSELFAKVRADGKTFRLRLSESNFPPLGSVNGLPEATCKEFPQSVFKPCVCDSQVPSTIKYRPSLGICGGNAAAILEGSFASSFSVVLRDDHNRDRVPAVGYNGCSQAEADLGLARCSAFKCQETFRTSGSFTCCFGEPGTSPIMAGATRLTIKLKDIPGSSADPLARLCLNNFDPTVNLN